MFKVLRTLWRLRMALLVPRALWVLAGTAGVPKAAIRFSSKVTESEQAFREKSRDDSVELHEWEKRDRALRKRYGRWNPTKKLSRQHMQSIRDLAEMMPSMKTVDIANHFQVSPEAIRRILKSKWVPDEKEEDEVLRREERRREQRKKHHDELKAQRKLEAKTETGAKTNGKTCKSPDVASPSSAQKVGSSSHDQPTRRVKRVSSQKTKRADKSRANAKAYDIEQIID